MIQLLKGAARDLPQTSSSRKSELGQFMTSEPVARYMASLFAEGTERTCRLLDAGAGRGSLTSAFLDRWASRGLTFKKVEATAYEFDDELRGRLTTELTAHSTSPRIDLKIVGGDFIELAAELCLTQKASFTHAILNPPYKKINSDSRHRSTLRRVGIEAVNLYAAFVALALELMAPGGQVVAIIPRSFCNGPYYRPFRDFLLERAAIHHIHLFDSRTKAFKQDEVLQENVIVLLERGGVQGKVRVSTSTDDTFGDMVTHAHPFNRIVFPQDSERFIHVPTSKERGALEVSVAVQKSLPDVGLQVSTGPVVDFRLREHLRQAPESKTVPLLYPGHFCAYGVEWPKPNMKKPNAIERNEQTEKWLFPNGFYCVVRRFSSKEEKRRIVASVVRPENFRNAQMLGFENHLNVFHENKRGLPEALAMGLAVFLNSSAMDESFRRFNGHTQVNATDLKAMKYPSRDALTKLGEWALKQGQLTQAIIDEKLQKFLA